MEHQRKLFQQRGYSEDLLPKTQSQRTWKTFNYSKTNTNVNQPEE